MVDKSLTANELFDQQVDRLLELDFNPPGVDDSSFRDELEPLRSRFTGAYRKADDLPPVIVLPRGFTTAEKLVEVIDRSDGQPDTVVGAEAMEKYETLESIGAPEGPYLLIGASKEPETRNIAPGEVLQQFAADGRSPLTIEEGLAIWRQFPDVIAPNDGFSLAGSSRGEGDKRVPAIWISKKMPKLGWCFMGVPHTWLATASCTGRIGAQ